MWQLKAVESKEMPQFKSFCDYFIERNRVGLAEGNRQIVYFIPPLASFVERIDLPDSTHMHALVVQKHVIQSNE